MDKYLRSKNKHSTKNGCIFEAPIPSDHPPRLEDPHATDLCGRRTTHELPGLSGIDPVPVN